MRKSAYDSEDRAEDLLTRVYNLVVVLIISLDLKSLL